MCFLFLHATFFYFFFRNISSIICAEMRTVIVKFHENLSSHYRVVACEMDGRTNWPYVRVPGTPQVSRFS
jgi:hypothetical protein